MQDVLALITDPAVDPLTRVELCERLKAFTDAAQLDALLELDIQEPSFLDPTGQLCQPAPAEVACALSWSPWTASRRVDLAHELHTALPCLLDQLRAGRLDLGKVQDIVRETCGLSPQNRVALAQRACDYATSHTRAQLKAWIARQLARLEPDTAEKRRTKARKQRRVWVQPESDGMATLGAYLTAEEAQACYQSLHADAANHEGGIDAARADLLVERLTGVTPADPIPVQVIITPTGPELPGHGPLSPAHAAQLCEGTTPIRLDKPQPTMRYAPSITLVRYVRARDRRCRFPGCRRPAIHCDIDHVTPWPAGSTTAENTACLCRYHHRLKTHTPWQVTMHPDGTHHWTSPKGRRYTTEPDDP